jgi:hypothetical protein
VHAVIEYALHVAGLLRARNGVAIVISICSAAASAAIASCTNGTAYDGSYEGGFTTSDGGAVVYAITPSTPTPLLFRSGDGQFGVYFTGGSFDANVTLTIAPAGGMKGNAYAVALSAPPKNPYVTFFANNGGSQNEMQLDDMAVPIQGNVNVVYFGSVPQTRSSGTFTSLNNQMGGGNGSSSQAVLPTCLANCGLNASGNNGGFLVPGACTVGVSGGGSNDTLGLFECVIKCGDPTSLASSCKSTASASVVCNGTTNGMACQDGTCCSGTQATCCVSNNGGPVGGETCTPPGSCNTTGGSLAFECDGAEDCPGQVCCANGSGTHCADGSQCPQTNVVCNGSRNGGSGSCAACTTASACTNNVPFATGKLMTCSPPSVCPFQGGVTSKSLSCPGAPKACTGSEVCCILGSNPNSGHCVDPTKGGGCAQNELTFACEGAQDCASTSSTLACCAYPGGTRCDNCNPSLQVCADDAPSAACGMMPTRCLADPQCNNPLFKVCGGGQNVPCPIARRAVPCPMFPGMTNPSACTGNMSCCIDTNGNGACQNDNTVCTGAGQKFLECTGPADCVESKNGSFCCAGSAGTSCAQSCMAGEQVVCGGGAGQNECNRANGGNCAPGACTPPGFAGIQLCSGPCPIQ